MTAHAALMLVAVVSAAPAAFAATPVERSFSDWSVTCDNGLRCVALGGQDDGGRMLMIERDAGADGAVSLEISGEDASFVDGKPVNYPAPAWRHEREEGFEARGTSDLGAIQAFIDAVRNGRRLHGRKGEEAAGVSLSGLSAALLYIDEAQGRLGTRGALLRRGGKAESTVPAAPALPVLKAAASPMALSQADATRLAAAVRRTQAAALTQADCTLDRPLDLDAAWPLTDSEALVHLGCWMGAYQGSGLLFRVPRAQPAKAVRVLLPALAGEKPRDILTTAHYDPAIGQLHEYAKGRGIGDCGETADWVFDGRQFVLAGYASMGRCTGVHADHWPTRWRTTTPTGSTP